MLSCRIDDFEVCAIRWRSIFLACLFFLASGCEQTDTTCETNNDCSDGLFCSGDETCSDSGHCVPGIVVVCDDGIDCTVDACNEIANSCEFLAPDLDGDGSGDQMCLDELGEPLGRDCDDNDPVRFGGNLEVCDLDQVDEDCDFTTFGETDEDGDGFISGVCCNKSSTEFFCGSDCDDDNVSIFPGAMACHPTVDQMVNVCNSDGLYSSEICDQQGRCFPQPNGTGSCVPF